MLLTQAQVRQLVEISEETFRTWREVLPMLKRPKGKPAFSLGDVLALRILRDMVNVLGMKISTVGPYGPELFEICDEAIGAHEAAGHLKFGPDGFEALNNLRKLSGLEQPVMVLPLRETIAALRSKLVSQGVEQAPLPFPALTG